jgi:hypothetical protein
MSRRSESIRRTPPRHRTALQQHAARRCRTADCCQMRSRSPVTSTENYALKIAAGYVLHPSHENDSYYFLLHLTRKLGPGGRAAADRGPCGGQGR